MNLWHSLTKTAQSHLGGVWCLLFALGLTSTSALAQRTALLIGNSSYQTGPLANPTNDVLQLERALIELGFKVQKLLNANQSQMKRALRDFGTQSQGVEIAVFYYSGHGTQVAGENYLLPIGATIEKEADYDIEAISANSVLRQISGSRPKATVVILDACRDNPYASVTRSTARGLGRMDAPTGTMIAFSTAPNTTASDEGHYSRVLANEIRKPGLELLDVFRNTTAEVRKITNGKQEPRISEMSITDRIYLAGKVQVPPPEDSTKPVNPSAIRTADVIQSKRKEEKFTLAADIFFHVRDSTILGEGKAKLDDLASRVKRYSNLEVAIVVGHVSSAEVSGPNDSGQSLSLRRAESVKEYLVKMHGIDKKIIYTDGKGKHQPVADNQSREGQSRNQRVEIEFVGNRAIY